MDDMRGRSDGLSERDLCLALFAKYIGLTIYGIAAAIIEVPTFVIVGSSTFATGWAVAVTLLAAAAALGVGRSWILGRIRLEKWTTAAFIVVFSAYSFALIYRSVLAGDYDSLPLAIIPVVVCILPTIRYYRLVLRNFFSARRAGKV